MTLQSQRKHLFVFKQKTEYEIELRVPRLERAALHEPAHAGVGSREACGEDENKPPGDRGEPRELHGREQHDAESDETPARPRVFQYVVPLLRESLREELMFETGHMRIR